MNYAWKIPELNAEGELITHAKYYIIADNELNLVETED